MHKIFTLFLLIAISEQAFTQSIPSKITDKISQEKEDDFLDSLTTYFYGNEQSSSLSARLGVTNHAYFAGRDYGIKQVSVVPTISYLHKSGVYIDLTGLAYSQSSPKYEITLASLGYMGVIGSKFIYFAEYSRSFYTNPDPDNPNPVPNSLTVFANYDLGIIMPTIAYAYLFGVSDYSQRVLPGISAYFKTKKIGFIDKITFSPNLYATLGDSKSYLNTIVIVEPPRLGRPAVLQQVLTEKNNFGLMAYTLSLPVGFKVSNFRFTLAANIIKPKKLYATEDITTNLKVNFSTSIYYSIDL